MAWQWARASGKSRRLDMSAVNIRKYYLAFATAVEAESLSPNFPFQEALSFFGKKEIDKLKRPWN